VNRRSSIILVSAIVAALIGVALLAIPQSPVSQKPTLGLDLQGGLEVTLQAVPPPNRPLQKSDLDRSVGILRNRVDRLGVAEPEIRTQGDNQIVIDLPGLKNPEQVIEILGKTAQLELFDLESNLVPPSIDAQRFPVAKESLYALLAGQQALVKESDDTTWYLFDAKKKLRAGPVAKRDKLLESKAVKEAGEAGALPKGWKIYGVPPKTAVLTCGVGEAVCPGVNAANPDFNSYYLIRFDPTNPDPKKVAPEMTGADLKLSGTRQDFDTTTGEAIVTMQFTGEGADKFGEITREEAVRGKQLSLALGGGQKITQTFAIVLDREIKSFPSIDWEQYPNGISGTNGAQITGIGDLQEAKDLALVLQTGALPVTFRTVENTQISATLGADSLEEAWKAAIAGLIAVALFLLIFYRILGIVAVIGLGIYAALLYAAILLFNVTLTLPGFAGMILTLGVAADANIVIFERVKEEYRAGKSVRAAIAAGYGKGFHTIIDANVVTAITAIVLFLVATAGVKGFALMLLIGTGMSLLTAVAATRAILGLLAGFNWFDNPKLMGAQGEPPKWIRRDFVGLRNRWFAISGVVLLLAFGAIVVKGLNLGIDFEGGTQITMTTPKAQPAALSDVRTKAAEIGQGDAQIFGVGDKLAGERYNEFRIRTESLPPAEQTAFTRALNQEFQADSSVKNVSASFGRQIAEGALLAIFVSLLLITIYISLRFQPKFAGPVMLALVHDVLITVGIYALLGREVTTATVAAVLTVLGYSIYDTIIIFDRIRENLPLMRRASFRTIANVSLWETIPRSLATTFITLLPISTLYFFGGETLKDFAFALLVGIGAGAYSSIFIAAPLLAVLKEREPEFARRRDDIVDPGSVGGLLKEAEELAAAQPTPDLIPDLIQTAGDGVPVADGAGAAAAASSSSRAKRERRRQRRSSRPHGRAR
jgi:SecD/SecF fusion protein